MLPDHLLEPTEHQQLVVKSADFVHGQLNSLPRLFRVAFWIGMGGFRCFVFLRYLRGFCRLSPERRVRLVERWAYGKLSVARQLFRVVRSTAMLCFYEDPQVIAELEQPTTAEEVA
jgi:hypothetical protein